MLLDPRGRTERPAGWGRRSQVRVPAGIGDEFWHSGRQKTASPRGGPAPFAGAECFEEADDARHRHRRAVEEVERGKAGGFVETGESVA